MIVVTHEMGFARKAADRVVFMADGRIVEEATPGAVLHHPETDRAKDFLSKILDPLRPALPRATRTTHATKRHADIATRCASRSSRPAPRRRSRCAGGAGDRHDDAADDSAAVETDARRSRPARRWPSSHEAGQDHRRHQVRPAAVRPEEPVAATLEGFDVEIAKIIAAELGIAEDEHRVRRDRLGQPRAVHPERQGRHRRRDLHDQRQAQGGRRLRRPVLRGRPGHPGRRPTTTTSRAPTTSTARGLLGRRARRPAANIAEKYPEAQLDRCSTTYSQVPRAAAQRPGRRGHHRQRHPRRPRRPERGRVQARRQAVHRGALRHRPEEGRHRRSATSSTTCSRRPTRTAAGPTRWDATAGQRCWRPPSRRRSTATDRPLTPPGGPPSGAGPRRASAAASEGGAVDVFIDNLPATRRLPDDPAAARAGRPARLVLGTLLAAMRVSPGPPLRGFGHRLRGDRPQHPADAGASSSSSSALPQLGFAARLLHRPRSSPVGCTPRPFVCEALRSGINSVPLGQAEAARASG